VSILIEMRDWFRRALHPTLPIAIVASCWVLASAQRPPLDRIYIGTWMESPGVFVTGDPYADDVKPLYLPIDADAETDEADRHHTESAEVPAYVDADIDIDFDQF
jgi:hypothetical protein